MLKYSAYKTHVAFLALLKSWDQVTRWAQTNGYLITEKSL